MGIDVEEGIHNVRMAMNLDHLNIDKIDSVSITQHHDGRFGALEV